jgi:hypothetical protein
MFSHLINALKAFFAHPATSVPAAVDKLSQIEQGIGVVTAVVSALPDGNTKTAAVDALDKAGSIAAQAVSVAHTVEAVGTATAAS